MDKAVENKNDAAITKIFTSILDILSKLQHNILPEAVNRIMAKNKDYLTPYFENYLKEKVKKIGIDALEKECGQNTIGQLILCKNCIQTEREKIKREKYLQTVYTQLLVEKMKALDKVVRNHCPATVCDTVYKELVAAFTKTKEACEKNGIEININGQTIKQLENYYFNVMLSTLEISDEKIQPKKNSVPVAAPSTVSKPSNNQLLN